MYDRSLLQLTLDVFLQLNPDVWGKPGKRTAVFENTVLVEDSQDLSDDRRKISLLREMDDQEHLFGEGEV